MEALQDVPMSVNKYGSQNNLRDKPSNINSLVMMVRPREKVTAYFMSLHKVGKCPGKGTTFFCSTLSSLVQSVAVIIMTKFPNDVTSRFNILV
jgi:hypothetical protein